MGALNKPQAVLCFLYLLLILVAAKITLMSDGSTETYELIRESFNGNSPYDLPDCSHEHFGPHITQQWDRNLGKTVFAFHIHTRPDNDRCFRFDRQRTEVKTYDKSPEETKGKYGDSFSYSWKFKIDQHFMTSPHFTHLHRLKASGGNDKLPVIALTARTVPDGTQKLSLNHVSSNGMKRRLRVKNLAPFKGEWIQGVENVTYSENGKYKLMLKRLSDRRVLFRYRNSNIDLWRETQFIRPKWGIYRSLKNLSDLRNETVLFDQFCVGKGERCP